ncbi:helix-turn-helix transcriptional regulator [Bacillus haimaensis]|uniref:helix-turn-helix domain-containing protein n=1 Tax=Bacillus haimaensis TaxID=3160967 RepID=UPI003AA8C638
MLVGEIIKYYRQRAGLTQEELGRGICSVTHVSKIESGKTPFSAEIIHLFSERLHIDIEKEVNRLENLGDQLHLMHKLIILQRMKEVEEIKRELDTMPIIMSSQYAALYLLLLARYYMLTSDYEKAKMILLQVQRDYPELDPYEKNMLRHVKGISYMIDYRKANIGSYQAAIQLLKKINREEYGNLEYYYHLAAAYQWVNSPVMSYSYAEKALRYFKEIDHFIGAILAESVMLIATSSDNEQDFNEVEATYKRLIYNSEMLNTPDKKTLLLNNLGYQYFMRKDYVPAKNAFQEALSLVPKPSPLYLQRWHNYLKCCFEGKLMRKTELLKKAREGLRMARGLDNSIYKIVFKLLVYKIEENDEKYYLFLEEVAIPYFVSSNSDTTKKRYGKELYEYYVKNEQFEKAVKIADILL